MTCDNGRHKWRFVGDSSLFIPPRDDDDINDVASMAGVNLSEESARILATNSDLVGAVTRSCKDEAFLSTSPLTQRALEIGEKHEDVFQLPVVDGLTPCPRLSRKEVRGEGIGHRRDKLHFTRCTAQTTKPPGEGVARGAAEARGLQGDR